MHHLAFVSFVQRRLNIDDKVMADLKREAARQGPHYVGTGRVGATAVAALAVEAAEDRRLADISQRRGTC